MKNIALLRGVNVGGNNKLPMKDLAAIFAEAGCTDVRTFIQSGNVVFNAQPEVLRGLSTMLTGRIADRFGFHTPVILRTAEELAYTIGNNPFLKRGESEDFAHAMFLADLPDEANAGGLDPRRSAPDEFRLHGREIYLHLPNGAGRTKLGNNYFDAKLRTISTGRNWRTVLKLFELTRAE